MSLRIWRGAGLSASTPRAVLLGLYWLPVLLLCGWVLSLPLFPSQDGPLHLYYVNVLRHLLQQQPGPYVAAYTIKDLLTPYAAYYYGLLALNSVVSLETADKVIVCLYIVGFAAAARLLLRTVSGDATWSSFLLLPVLLNWPVFMGFLNYSLSTCIAICAMALWCAGVDKPGMRSRVQFLLLIAGMTVTHPVPWMMTVSFAMLELAARLLRQISTRYREGVQPAMRHFQRDAITVLVACLPYLYIRQFRHAIQTLEPPQVEHDPLLVRFLSGNVLILAERARSFLQTMGIDVFADGNVLLQLYRIGIRTILLGSLAAALWSFGRRWKRGEWALCDNWIIFLVCLLPVLLFLPDPFEDRYCFAARMGIMFYVSCIAAISPLMRRSGLSQRAAALFAYLLCLLTCGLLVRYVTPAARNIATLRQAPDVSAQGRPGLAMVPVGSHPSDNLTFLPDNWATAHYYRWHNLVLYNTAWLGDPIIMVGVKPQMLSHLDGTYYESLPWFGSQMLPNDEALRRTLGRVGFVVLMRQNAPLKVAPLAEDDTAVEPGAAGLGWNCVHAQDQAWYLCQRGDALVSEGQ